MTSWNCSLFTFLLQGCKLVVTRCFLLNPFCSKVSQFPPNSHTLHPAQCVVTRCIQLYPILSLPSQCNAFCKILISVHHPFFSRKGVLEKETSSTNSETHSTEIGNQSKESHPANSMSFAKPPFLQPQRCGGKRARINK